MRLSEIGALTSASIEFIGGIACFRVRSVAKTVASANRLIPVSKSLQSLVDLTDLLAEFCAGGWQAFWEAK